MIIPVDAYIAAGESLRRYHVAEADRLSLVTDVLHAVTPIILVAELAKVIIELHELRQAARVEDGRGIRASGIGEAIDVIACRVAELEA